MENEIKDAWAWIGREIVDFGIRWVIVGAFAVLGTLIFGRGYKRRIKALEDRARSPAIEQTFNFYPSSNADEHDRQLRDAIEAKTTHNLKETIKRLPKLPLGDGHSYAQLPDGTNIVTMADGTVRLALPVRLSVSFSGGLDGSLSASVTTVLTHGGDKPDEGQEDL